MTHGLIHAERVHVEVITADMGQARWTQRAFTPSTTGGRSGG